MPLATLFRAKALSDGVSGTQESAALSGCRTKRHQASWRSRAVVLEGGGPSDAAALHGTVVRLWCGEGPGG